MKKELITKSCNLLSIKKTEWLNLLTDISNNRVLYVFSKFALQNHILTEFQRRDLNKILSAGEVEMEKFRKTIRFLHDALDIEKIDFLIVKTFKFYDYVTYDIDVLVRFQDFEKAQESLKKAGCEILSHPRKQGLHQRNCKKDGLLNIDLHRKFFWQGLEHIDEDFVWEKVEKRSINGIECNCPSLEVDFLLHYKQLMYERYYVTLLDYLAYEKAVEVGLDRAKMEHQVYKYKWRGTYDTLLKTLNLLAIEQSTISFPYIFSYIVALKQFVEIIINQGKFVFFDFAYYHFTFLRYFLGGKKRMPYYIHWFDFESLK